MNTVNENSIAHKSAIDQETAEVLQMASDLRQGIAYGDTRSAAILNVLVHNLHLPGAVEMLRQELLNAPFTPNTADIIKFAQGELAAHDAPFETIIQPPAPGAAKPKKKSSRRKARMAVEIRVDVEAGRSAAALHLTSQWRLWVVAQEQIRELHKAGKADNYVTVKSLYKSLESFGITYKRPNFRHLLRTGQEHGFWTINRGRIFIAGRVRVAEALARLAYARGMPEVVTYDRPGVRDRYIDVGGKLIEFEFGLYRTWLALNNDPTISRETLSAIWNRCPEQLRTWESMAHIEVTPNFAQTTDYDNPHIPDHAITGEIQTSAGITEGWTWQLPNTYKPSKLSREHGHKGQGRKVRRAINAICDDEQHPENEAGAHPFAVRYFDNPNFQKAWGKCKKTTHDDNHTDYLLLGIPKRRRPEGQRIRVWELIRGDRAPQTMCGAYKPVPAYRRVKHAEI